jgi:SAM-dependent methyltransferase
MKKQYTRALFIAGMTVIYATQAYAASDQARMRARTASVDETETYEARGGAGAVTFSAPSCGSAVTRAKSLGTLRRELLYEVRGGDYAHAGDAKAIDLVWHEVPLLPAKGTILDIGCGTGGTLQYIESHYNKGARGLVGVDIDYSALDIARDRYRSCATFMEMDVSNLGRDFPAADHPLSLTLSFNSFYAFDDHPHVLADLFKLTLPGGYIAVFDYAVSDKTIDHGMVDLAGKPMNVIHPPTFNEQLITAGWQLDKVVDLNARYIEWYETLIARMDEKKDMLVGKYGMGTYTPVYETMTGILTKVRDKRLGGALFIAHKPA